MTTPRAYYNDNDPKVATVLRELIRRQLIADGEVDERSILDVEPSDLAGFTQCHFFAGIGGWSYALRLVGWPDWRPVWTGSPPCQPFSAAGQRQGRHDERHLAPHFAELIDACRPDRVFGEQVASAEVFGKVAKPTHAQSHEKPQWAWVDDLSARLEASCYAFGASDLPSSSVGAPHIRQRTFFGAIRLADPDDTGSQGRGQHGCERALERSVGSGGMAGGMGDSHGTDTGPQRQQSGRQLGFQQVDGGTLRLEHSAGDGWIERWSEPDGRGIASRRGTLRTDQDHSPWGNPDWLRCRDELWRPVEPGTFPLADGIPARMVRLRGYGNAINPHLAAEFIKAFEESLT